MIKPLFLAFTLLAASPATAQQWPPTDELLALHTYVQQGEQPAVQAELRRLELKYPQWTPPTDLSKLTTSAPQAEIDQFYKEIAAGQIDAARGTLAKARSAYPDWTPSPDMTNQLHTAVGQKALDNALKGGDLDAARSVAARTPGLLRCEQINNAWRMADGEKAAGKKPDALAIYRAILGACVTPADLVATLEKADGASSEAELQAMVAQVSGRFPAETARFEAVLQRLLAGRGVTPDTPKTVTVTPAAQPPETAQVRSQPSQRSAAQPQRQAAEAGTTKQPRHDAQRTPTVQPRRAPHNESPAQCTARLATARDPGSVLERAWCVYNMDRTMESMSDFRTALRGRLSAQQRRDAQYGLSLAYLKMGMSEEASQIAAQADFDQHQRVDVERQILDQRGVMAYKQQRYRDAIRYFDAIEQVSGSIRRDLAILRAYAYLNAGQQSEALSEFRRLNNQLSTKETRRGLMALSSD